MKEVDQDPLTAEDSAQDFIGKSHCDDRNEDNTKSEYPIDTSDLSPVIFWDTNPSRINWDKHPAFVISRAVMYGILSDWKAVCTYYGLDQIREEMIQVRDLDPKSLHFLSLILNVPKEQFRCYMNQQLQAPHWI